MACLGVHFALSSDDVALLLSKQNDEERLSFVQEGIEERYFDGPRRYIAQSDKAWDAMQRAHSDGLLSYEGGEYPLNHAVLGGQPLYSDEDYIISLKTPEQVKDVALVLAGLTQAQFRELYAAINPEEYGFDLTDEDFRYTWQWFKEVCTLYQTAASEGRHVLFTADQ